MAAGKIIFPWSTPKDAVNLWLEKLLFDGRITADCRKLAKKVVDAQADGMSTKELAALLKMPVADYLVTGRLQELKAHVTKAAAAPEPCEKGRNVGAGGESAHATRATTGRSGT